MPQTTQPFLIHILLLWTTILSIIQIVLIILFFTAGHTGLSQNSSAKEAEHNMQSQGQTSSEDEYLLGKGKMITFKATKGDSAIKWVSKSPNPGLVSDNNERGGLTIMKDGYYFVNFQVTREPSCKDPANVTSQQTVSLKWNNSVLLEGWINTKTNSTGILSKVEQLSAGGTLTFNITPPSTCVNESESVTHLDIIYMVKP